GWGQSPFSPWITPVLPHPERKGTLTPVLQQVALGRERALQAVAHAADLEHHATDLRGGQAIVGPVLAQLQVGHAVEFADGQVAHPRAPVEGERAACVDAGDRGDHGAGPKVVAAVVVLDLGQEDRLVAAPAVERQLHAHHVGLLHGDPEVAADEVAADLFEVLHGAGAHGRSGYPSRRWTPCLPTCLPPASSPRSAPFPAVRWPATGRSRAAPACPGARGWWRGCWPATRTTRCP